VINDPYSQPEPPMRGPLPMVKPRFTYIFLGICAVVFVLMTLTGGTESSRNLIRWGANYAPLVASGEYWRLFTANFIHIGVLHLAFNLYALFQLGQQVESIFGYPRFITIYLLSGVSGAVFSYLLTSGLSAGASTSLFGLFGALVVYFYKHREMFGKMGQQQLINLGVILLVNVIIGLAPGSSIDNWGHLGGFVGGVALAWFLCPSYAPVDPFSRAMEPAMPQARKPELSNGVIMDTNSLPRQIFPVAVFVAALVALTVLATSLQ
jgi:membrane associated rhomboid family serine protease